MCAFEWRLPGLTSGLHVHAHKYSHEHTGTQLSEGNHQNRCSGLQGEERLWAGVGTQLFPFNENIPPLAGGEGPIRKLRKLTRLWKFREWQDLQASFQGHISSNNFWGEGTLKWSCLHIGQGAGRMHLYIATHPGVGFSVPQRSLNHLCSCTSLPAFLWITPVNSLAHWARFEWNLFFGLWSVHYLGWIDVCSCLLGKSHAPWIS